MMPGVPIDDEGRAGDMGGMAVCFLSILALAVVFVSLAALCGWQ